MMSPAHTKQLIQLLLHQILSWYLSTHHRNFVLPPQTMGGREKIKRAVGRDWKGKQENDQGCFKKLKERGMQSAGKSV